MNEFENDYSDVMTMVQETAEQPTPEFKALLDARVSAGFPKKPRSMAMFNFGQRRPRLAVIGVAASALLALAIAVSIDTQTTTRDAEIPSDAGSGGGVVASQEPAAPQSRADLESAAKQTTTGSADEGGSAPDSALSIAPEPPPTDNFVGGRSRRIQRSAAMTLAADEKKLGEVGDQVIAVTDRYRGFVQRSSVTSAEEGGAGGSFDLRIPVRNLRPAMRDLSALATVKSRTENADDVTASFRGAREALQELQADRRGLLRRLEKAQTETAAEAIRARIRIVNSQIDAQNQQLQDIRRRTAYAQVAVTLVADDGASSGGGSGIGDGARDLRDSLIDSVNIALRVLGVAIPLAIVAALLWLLMAGTRRHRREATLG